MAQIFDIQRVDVGLENLTARVRVANDAPLMTSEDLVGTTRVYNLMPHIIEHVCLGDAGETFKDVMGNTELAHLLEHMTVELLSQSSAAAEVTTGRTYPVAGDPRLFDVELSCSDDVLVVGALSSAVWIANWAYSGGGEPEPDVEAIVAGLTNMVRDMGEGPEDAYRSSVEAELKRAFDEEYQRLYEERERQIAAREEEIASARAAAQAEAETRMAEARRRAEEEARRRAEERAAAEAELRPAWAVDVDEYEAHERERLAAEAAARDAAEAAALAAAEQEASERAALSAQAQGEVMAEEQPEAAAEPADEAEVADYAEVADEAEFEEPAAGEPEDGQVATASELSQIFNSQPQIDPLLDLAEKPEAVESEPEQDVEPEAAPAAEEPAAADEPEPAVEEPALADPAEDDAPIELDGNFNEPIEELLGEEAPELPWDEPADEEAAPAASEANEAVSADVEHIPQARRVR